MRGTIYEELLEIDAIKSCINAPECARYLARVPTGFYVVHGVREPKAVRVTTSDSTFTIYADDEKRKIDWRKQVDGIVAHFVHACDIDLFHRVLRDEFVRIYAEPVLQKFLEEQRQAHPDLDLPEPPQAGDLDIRRVIESPYFFA